MVRVFYKLLKKPANPSHHFAFQGVCFIDIYPAISSFSYSKNPNELEAFALHVYHNFSKMEKGAKGGRGTIFYLNKKESDKLIEPFEHLASEHIIPLSNHSFDFCKGCNRLNNLVNHMLSDEKEAINGLMKLVFGNKEI